MPVLNREKFVKLISYCLGKEFPKDNPIRKIIEEEGRRKHLVPLGSFYLRGLDMDSVIALHLPKKDSSDGLDHYLFTWVSKSNMSIIEDEAHATLQMNSVIPMHFSLRGKPEQFIKTIGESSIIQSILVDLIDDLKCLESFTIFNKRGSQKDALIPIPSDLLSSTFIVQTQLSEEPTDPINGKVERMEIALPQIIDLANYTIMSGLKMFGPISTFTNFCFQCGKKLPTGESKFCIHCGAKLS